MRYMIASLAPENIKGQLKYSYETAFRRACSVRTPHLTFIPPFTIETQNIAKVQAAIHQLPHADDQFSFGSPGIFTVRSGRHVLYLPVEPQAPLQAIYQDLLQQLMPMIHIETGTFAAGIVPEFLAHVTLDYDFKQPHPSSLVPPSHFFILPHPELLVEQGPGIWQPL